MQWPPLRWCKKWRFSWPVLAISECHKEGRTSHCHSTGGPGKGGSCSCRILAHKMSASGSNWQFACKLPILTKCCAYPPSAVPKEVQDGQRVPKEVGHLGFERLRGDANQERSARSLRFQPSPITRRNWNSFQMILTCHSAASRGDFPARQVHALASEFKRVCHRLGANAFDVDSDVQQMLKARRLHKIAGRRHARKTQQLPLPFELYRQAALAKELDLGRLHPAKEVGEVRDAGHVGVAKLDAPRGAVGLHGTLVNLNHRRTDKNPSHG